MKYLSIFFIFILPCFAENVTLKWNVNCPDYIAGGKMTMEYSLLQDNTQLTIINMGVNFVWGDHSHSHLLQLPKNTKEIKVTCTTSLQGHRVKNETHTHRVDERKTYDCGKVTFAKKGESNTNAYVRYKERAENYLKQGAKDKALLVAKSALILADEPLQQIVATRLLASADRKHAAAYYLATANILDRSKLKQSTIFTFHAETFDSIENEAIAKGIKRDKATGLRFAPQKDPTSIHVTKKVDELHALLQKQDKAYAEKTKKQLNFQLKKLGSDTAAKENLLREKLGRSPYMLK